MEAKPQPGICSMPPLVRVKFWALQRTKPLLCLQKLQENKNQTNKANLQIRLGVLKQACSTQLRKAEFSVFELLSPCKVQMGRELQLREPLSSAVVQKKRTESCLRSTSDPRGSRGGPQRGSEGCCTLQLGRLSFWLVEGSRACTAFILFQGPR